AYPISFGPACWLASRTGIGAGTLPLIYRPIIGRMNPGGSYESNCSYDTVPPKWTLHYYPSGIISRYAALFAATGWRWRQSVDSKDQFDLDDRIRDGQWEWSTSR